MGCRAVNGAIPAILAETLLARHRDIRTGPLQASGKNCATYTGWPLRILGSICHGCHIVPILDDGVAFGIVVLEIECGNVREIRVRKVGNVDNQRGGCCHIARVAAEECRVRVESEVDERVLIWNRREYCPIRNTRGVETALIRRDQAGSIRPVEFIVCRAVNGEDNVHLPGRLDKWVQWYVLEVFAAINQEEGC